MEPDEVDRILERAREYRARVEAVFAPGHLDMVGKIWDWPVENVKQGLPHWSKIRFYVGRSTGRKPILLLIPNRRSSGGGSIYAGEFVYVRILSENTQGRWDKR